MGRAKSRFVPFLGPMSPMEDNSGPERPSPIRLVTIARVQEDFRWRELLLLVRVMWV